MSDWNFLNKHRAHDGSGLLPDTDASWGFNGFFLFPWPGVARQIKCIASDGGPDGDWAGGEWQHVSVSLNGSHRPPTWDIMCIVKDLFWEPEDVVIQIHPRKSEYVNNHPGCLHLWRSLKEVQPLPPSFCVGDKNMSYRTIEKMKAEEIRLLRLAALAAVEDLK
jgi:hypothetical protein